MPNSCALAPPGTSDTSGYEGVALAKKSADCYVAFVSRALERMLRNQLTVSILLVWLGIILSVYGSFAGGPITLVSMLWLAANIHRLGRLGA